MELLHIPFVDDGRETPQEISEAPEKTVEIMTDKPKLESTMELSYRHYRRFEFWSSLVEYCKTVGREKDIGSRKPSYGDWYDVTLSNPDYHVFFQLYHQKILRIGIYVYHPDAFARLESKKSELETLYGSPFDWYTSRPKSAAKRILHSIDADVHNPKLCKQHFDWLIAQFDALRYALETVDKM
jgi:hypothetical protein